MNTIDNVSTAFLIFLPLMIAVYCFGKHIGNSKKFNTIEKHINIAKWFLIVQNTIMVISIIDFVVEVIYKHPSLICLVTMAAYILISLFNVIISDK